MSGIIVGVDGSGHSQRALEWAMKEAAIRHTPLTVLTVHEALRGYYGGTAVHPDDPARTEQAHDAARAETDKVLAGWPARSPSTRIARSSSCRLRVATDGERRPGRSGHDEAS